MHICISVFKSYTTMFDNQFIFGLLIVLAIHYAKTGPVGPNKDVSYENKYFSSEWKSPSWWRNKQDNLENVDITKNYQTNSWNGNCMNVWENCTTSNNQRIPAENRSGTASEQGHSDVKVGFNKKGIRCVKSKFSVNYRFVKQ